MRMHWRRGLAVLGMWSVAAGIGMAAPPVEPDASAASAARSWLARIHAAASGRNYEGTMVVTAGGVRCRTSAARAKLR